MEEINLAEETANKEVYNHLINFLSHDIEEIQSYLMMIKSSLIQTHDINTYMIKFTDDSQHLISEQWQSYLKGLIFQKINTQINILSVSYSIPYDTSYTPNIYELVHRLSQTDVKYKRIQKGTLLKLAYYNDKWNLSSNGVDNAYISKFPNKESFGTKFDKFFKIENYHNLITTMTYVFILTDKNLYHSATISNNSLNEYDCDIGISQFYYISNDEFSKWTCDTENNYIIEQNIHGNVFRYLFTLNIDQYILEYIRGGVDFPIEYMNTNRELINKTRKNVTELYKYLYESYVSHYIKKDKYVYPTHIWQTLNNIHNLVYINYLKPRNLKVTLTGISYYFQNYSNSRELYYCINDFNVFPK